MLRRIIGLPSELLEQFDERLDDVWEPFLCDDDDSAPAASLVGSFG